MGVSRAGAMAGLLAPLLLMIAGCGSFFNPKGTSSGTGSGSGSGTGTGGAGAVYLANANLQSLSAYSLANGRLANRNVTGGALGDSPSSLAINPAHTVVWVGSHLGFIFAYTVNNDGSLALLVTGTTKYVFNIANTQISSMAVDPTGKYLLALCSPATGTAPIVYVLAIGAGGTLTQTGTLGLDAGTAFQITFAPNGTQAFAALGTGGVNAMTFNPGNGVLTKLSLNPGSMVPGVNADQGLAIDPDGKYLFVTETGLNGVRVLDIANNLNPLGAYKTGLGAKGVLVDHTGAYVYVTNSTTTTISQFALSGTGGLTPLAAPTVTTGTSPYSLAEDSSNTFILAASNGGNPDLQMFSIGTDGSLTSVQPVTGSTPAGSIAVVATPPAT